MLTRQLLPVGILMVLGLVAGVLLSLWLSAGTRGSEAERPSSLLWPNPKTLAAFRLVDQRGAEFDASRFHGRWSLVFFGYTHCPDICPTTLQLLNDVVQKTDPRQATQVVFVSVDPERDTPERLKDYVESFNPSFVGVTGSVGQLHTLFSQVGVVAIPSTDDGHAQHLIDHSGSILLVDPHARLLAVFSASSDATYIAAQLRDIAAFLDAQT